MSSIYDDIFLYAIEENADGTIYEVCYSLAGHKASYSHRPFLEQLQAIKKRCEYEKDKKSKGDWFNNFEKWDALRQTAELLGKMPEKFIVLKK
jgi:hypothetical protein